MRFREESKFAYLEELGLSTRPDVAWLRFIPPSVLFYTWIRWCDSIQTNEVLETTRLQQWRPHSARRSEHYSFLPLELTDVALLPKSLMALSLPWEYEGGRALLLALLTSPPLYARPLHAPHLLLPLPRRLLLPAARVGEL